MRKILIGLWIACIAGIAVSLIVWAVHMYWFVQLPSWISVEAFRLQKVWLAAIMFAWVFCGLAWLMRYIAVSRR